MLALRRQLSFLLSALPPHCAVGYGSARHGLFQAAEELSCSLFPDYSPQRRRGNLRQRNKADLHLPWPWASNGTFGFSCLLLWVSLFLHWVCWFFFYCLPAGLELSSRARTAPGLQTEQGRGWDLLLSKLLPHIRETQRSQQKWRSPKVLNLKVGITHTPVAMVLATLMPKSTLL